MLEMMGCSWLGAYQWEHPEKQQKKATAREGLKFKHLLPSLVTPCPAKHHLSPYQPCFFYHHEEPDIAP